ncbi:hypothetical protein [Aurantivibrio plasticivorans]
MRDQLESLIPVFLDSEGERLSQVATGVLIDFRGETFILTAGHVIDHFERGCLMVPNSSNEIVSIDGVYSYIKPENGRRDDFLDYGYFKLDNDFGFDMKKSFYAIPEAEFGIRETYSESEKISFGGYPHRKSNVAGGIVYANDYIYGAYNARAEEYRNLNYPVDANIVAKFNRKKTIDPYSGKIQMAPLPHGISGGGIFVWPETPTDLIPRNRKLIGIGHTYKEKGGYFIGTRLEVILSAILHNNPELALET